MDEIRCSLDPEIQGMMPKPVESMIQLLHILKKGGIETNEDFKRLWKINNDDQDWLKLFGYIPSVNLAKIHMNQSENAYLFI